MEIQYTPKFLRLLGKLKDKRAKEETEKVVDKIKKANDFVELTNLLDVKKYVVGSYRIRYSGKPEMRIKFSLIPNQKDGIKNIVELRWVGTREEYDKEWKTMSESTQQVFKKRTYIINEIQLNKIMFK